jgi:hypothetical protein
MMGVALLLAATAGDVYADPADVLAAEVAPEYSAEEEEAVRRHHGRHWAAPFRLTRVHGARKRWCLDDRAR